VTDEEAVGILALLDWDRLWPDGSSCDYCILTGRQAKALMAYVRRTFGLPKNANAVTPVVSGLTTT
jgi:hypothetical protein